MNKYILPCLLLAFLFLFPTGQLLAHDMNAGSGLSGTVLDQEDNPLQNAVAVFFSTKGPAPDPARNWRIPDGGRMIFEGGRFMVGLPAGHYYFGIIKDPPPDKIGQPSFEDWLYFSRDKKGTPISYQVKAGKVHDLGVITVAGPLTQKQGDIAKENTSIMGRLTSAEGQPLANFIVEAFSAREIDRRVLFSSERTTDTGEYQILVAPGSYSIGIRALPGPDRVKNIRYDLILPSTVTLQKEGEQRRLDLKAGSPTER